ncbi:MAG TPA: HIT domain-containing protein [Xanthobacteraceae bacterium]|nr:HIT domain-containing protein [Xanthobacteraceae bacterium]
MPSDWTLDPELARDTTEIGDLPLCRLLLNNDANYSWLILVPRQAGAIELIDLSDADRTRLMQEISVTSLALRKITSCDKLNVAALGNRVRQLHFHVLARFTNDAAWPNPVWGQAPARDYDPKKREQLIRALRLELAIAAARM